MLPRLVGLVVLAAALASCKSAAFEIWSDDEAGPPPSDEQLRALVHAHRRELDELRTMIAAEPHLDVIGTDRVGDCWRFQDGWSCNGVHAGDSASMLRHVGLAADRWTTYRGLLAIIGAHRIARQVDQAVWVQVYASGIVTSGTTKDLVWSRSPPLPVVTDTDRERSSHYSESYAAAGDNWYIAHASN